MEEGDILRHAPPSSRKYSADTSPPRAELPVQSSQGLPRRRESRAIDDCSADNYIIYEARPCSDDAVWHGLDLSTLTAGTWEYGSILEKAMACKASDLISDSDLHLGLDDGNLEYLDEYDGVSDDDGVD